MDKTARDDVKPLDGSERSECDRLRSKWAVMLTGGTDFDPLIPEFADIVARITDMATSWWSSMNRLSGREYIWDDLSDWSNSATLTSNYKRIWQMTLACYTHGSKLYKHPELERDVIDALDWMHAHRYNPRVAMYDNWWDWHIGVPLLLLDCMTLLFDRLGEQRRNDYFEAIDLYKPDVSPHSTGANRVWECRILAIRGIIGHDPQKIVASQHELRPVFAYVTEGDGFYRDGSYIQHDVYAYTGGYGQSLLQELSYLMALFAGSQWEQADAGSRHIFRWVYDSYEPLMYRGAMMDMSMGRVVSRSQEQNREIGRMIARSVIRLARIAPDQDSLAFRSMVKEWILSGARQDFYDDACLETAFDALRIVLDAAVPRRGELRMHRSFANMARSVHHRPGYAFAVSMHSDRIANYESINNENLRGWHSGDGMTYLYNGDLTQYCDNFWPTVNAYRLPGTTALRETEIAAGKVSDQQWVGGTSLHGVYGAAGMSLQPFGQSLRARKSWFMFDEEIVAIGSGIHSQDGIMAETIIENRKLNEAGDNKLTVNGDLKPAELGWSEIMEGVVWIHLQGSESGSDIGYYFPEPTAVHGLRVSRSGLWREINRFEKDSVAVTRHYLELLQEHGVDPQHASYAYVLLPNKSASEMEKYAASPFVEVLANTEEVHAARCRQSCVKGVNVWVDGGAAAAGIWADRQCSILVMERDDRLEIAVSDPTFRNVGTIQIELAREAVSVHSQDAAITVLRLRPAIRLIVDVSQAGGRTFHACFILRDTG